MARIILSNFIWHQPKGKIKTYLLSPLVDCHHITVFVFNKMLHYLLHSVILSPLHLFEHPESLRINLLSWWVQHLQESL